MSEPAYDLVLELTSDAPEYAQGFEMGTLWERLKQQPESGTFHAENAEQMRVIARRLGYRVELRPLADGWVSAEFLPLE